MTLSPGTRLGPYEILAAIGAGGMGEVYKARDTRLDRDVAIKVLPDDIAGDADRLRRFEEEARAVAALNHPNILTVHDVGAQGGTSFVVTELLEGETLRELLSRRLPTQRQLLSVAVQAAHGLAAAHRKGIVHRDLKPENVFVTTDGRVKILDFGLAKRAGTRDGVDATTEGVTEPGMLMGTLAYMSPEQARGETVGLASDVFSFGVVLYELLARRHPFRRDTVAATLSAILHETPPPPSSVEGTIPPALDGVVRRCLEKDQAERFASGHELAVVLEAVLQAPSGAVSLQEVEERSPYPGLRSFTEKDARTFFGREAEVTALWERIRARRLLAVIGPSGAGKTSFLRAGVIPARPDGWAAVACTPGTAPLRGLGQALGPALAADHEALSQLAGFEDPDTAFTLVSRWRQAHADALLVVDQFEEVFTLNPPEVQARFAELLARLASEADVHVVLSLRDDFLMRCHDHPCLAAIFDGLTPLGALTREGLCRALIEPAARLGYRFEEAALVEEMVGCVEGARAALPLLAFAVSRLWEQRDRERKVLTRAAYEDIGGVAGALAQHAEATLDRIGSARQALVREVFRNLVTAQGTRAVVDRDELLSAFPERDAAEAALRDLVDARLLTSYEVEGREGEPNRHRIEIVHESLLKAWPRLVRWQTQDEEGAQLRDQLKQAARLWTEKGRSADLLWTGTAYREYALWRERYTAPLTAVENAFAAAMAARAKRTKRVRAAAVGALVVGLTAVAIAIGISRRTAIESARRAEASKLIALGQVELDRNPAAALAFARASLEMMESAEGRLLAVQALWAGPPAVFAPSAKAYQVVFSPDGKRLALSGFADTVTVLSDDGGHPVTIAGLPTTPARRFVGFTPRGDHLLTWLDNDPAIRIFSVSGEAVGALASRAQEVLVISDDSVATYGPFERGTIDRGVRIWSMRDHLSRLGARWRPPTGFRAELTGIARDPTALHPSLLSLAYALDNAVHLVALAGPDSGRDVVIGTHEASVGRLTFTTDGDRLLSVDRNGRFRIWSVTDKAAIRSIDAPVPLAYSPPVFDASGSRLGWASGSSVFVWKLDDPPDASLLRLRTPGSGALGVVAIEANARWAAAGSENGVSLFSLASPHVRVFEGHAQDLWSLAFTADSAYLASCARDGARLWPLAPSGGRQHLISLGEEYWCYGISADPKTQDLLVTTPLTGAFLVRPDGTAPRRLEGIPRTTLWGAALDSRARLAAVGVNFAQEAKDMGIHVADLRSGAVRTFATRDPAAQTPFGGAAFGGAVNSLGFVADGSLVSGGEGGVYRWDLSTGTRAKLAGNAGQMSKVALNLRRDNMVAVTWTPPDPSSSDVLIIDPTNGTQRRVSSHGRRVSAVAMDASGKRIATGDSSGAVRVGWATGEEPHLLLGHRDPVSAVTFSPDGKWIASAGGTEIRLWPMPDLSKPPLHTLPHDLLIAKLESLTNLRVVRDVASSTGWKTEVGPFPGWRNIPTW